MDYTMNNLHNEEIERQILSCCFDNNTLVDELNVKWFYTSSNRKIVQAMKELRNQHKDIDILILAEYIKAKKIPVTLTEITSINNTSFTTSNANSYIKILKELANKRILFAKLNQLDYSIDTDKMVDNILAICETLYKADNELDTCVMGDEYLKDLINKSDNYIKTGLKNLDYNIHGLHEGQLITVTAYTGMGKSTMISQLILNMLRTNKKISLFSLEMNKNEILNRICSNACNIEFNKLYTKNFNEEEYNKVCDFISNIIVPKTFKIYDSIHDINDIVRSIRHDKLKKNIEIVFIDLINRVSCSSIAKNRAEYLGEITRRLKLLALELNICIVITAQINRVVESRDNKRPTLADIKESGGIAEDSDLVLGLYRNTALDDRVVIKRLHEENKLNYNSYNPDENPEAIEVLVLKGRNVKMTKNSFQWNGSYQRIQDWVK